MNTLVLNNLTSLPFDVEESINQLRVNLSFNPAGTKVIFVTSTVPNEGKSFIAFNLWRSLAATEKRVLLIDADLRMSTMRNDYDFSVENSYVGLAHYLSGQAGINDVVYDTNIPNGFIVPVTNLIVNPAPLLESDRYEHLIKQTREIFDYVIIDTPPLGSVADALNISRYTDGCLLVVRSGGISRKLVKESVDSLKRVNASLLGVVLNRVDIKKQGGYYRSYYKYGYYYDNTRPKKNGKKKKKK